jgi:hypothetical protein
MQDEQHEFDNDDLAKIWRCAQHRRAEEIYSWLTHFLNKRWQLKSTGGRPHMPKVTPAHWETARRATSTFGTFRTRGFP